MFSAPDGGCPTYERPAPSAEPASATVPRTLRGRRSTLAGRCLEPEAPSRVHTPCHGIREERTDALALQDELRRSPSGLLRLLPHRHRRAAKPPSWQAIGRPLGSAPSRS